MIYGARPSVLVSICASFGVFILAGSFGLLAGYFPGFVDALISRTADVLFAVPGIVVLIVILNSVPDRSIWIIVGVILLIGWPGGMRLMRATVFSVRNREYVLAARSIGVPPGADPAQTRVPERDGAAAGDDHARASAAWSVSRPR